CVRGGSNYYFDYW
nr:immunoglobulin heavy chain junction region [Mus musculus]